MPTTIKHNQINLPTGATPETPPAGQSTLFVDSNGIVRQKDSTGVVTPLSGSLSILDGSTDLGSALALQTVGGYYINTTATRSEFYTIPNFSANRFIYGWPNGNGAYGSFGGIIGEVSPGATAIQEFKGTHFTRKYTTNTVAANVAGTVIVTAEFRSSHFPYMSTIIHTGASIAAQRMWIGLFSASPLNVATLGTTQGFGFSYFSSDGNLSWITSNGTTTTRTTIMTMAADTSYRLDCWSRSDRVSFSVNNDAATSTTLTLPATTTNLFYYNRVVNTTTTSNTLNIGNIYIEAT